MEPTELPFEYVSRSMEIYRMLFPNPTFEQQRAIELLVQNQRDLEDHLKKPTGGGTAAASILDIQEHKREVSNGSDPGFNADYTVMAFDVPNDPAFIYFLEWFIDGQADLPYDQQFQWGGTAQVLEQPPGAGFEHWGWAVYAPEVDPAYQVNTGGRNRASGTGHRVERIDSGLLGTTIHLRILASLYIEAGAVSVPTHYTIYSNAKLLAIPA